MQVKDGIEFAHAVLEFGIVPLIIVIYRLTTSINDLKVTLYRDFVTKADLRHEKE